MSIIIKPNTFSSGATIIASEHNSNFDTIYTDYCGNITNSNISASAGITDGKLAQITTPSKVSGLAITALASVPSSAGIISVLNLATGTTGATTYLRGDSTWAGVNTINGLLLLDSSGLITQTYLGSGTTGSTTYLRGDQTWQTISPGNIPNAIPGTGLYIECSNDTERTSASQIYVELKEFSPITRGGSYNVYFECHSTNAGGQNANGRVYKNGVALGTEQVAGDTYQAFNENLTFASGDTAQVYGHGIGGQSVFIRNFRLRCNNPITPQGVTSF